MALEIEIWQAIIGLVVCLAVGIIGTVVVKNGWESKILGAWESMKVMYKTFVPFVEQYDKQFAEELKAMFTTLEEAFADGGLTLAEFNDIVKTFKPLWNRFMEFIKDMKTQGLISTIKSEIECVN